MNPDRSPRWTRISRLVGAVAMVAAAAATAAPYDDGRRAAPPKVPKEPVARVIVALKSESSTVRRQALSTRVAAETVAQVAQSRADGLAARAGVALTAGRVLGPRAQVVKASGIDSATLAARLRSHPEVQYAVVDRRIRVAAVPNDPLFAGGPASGRGPAVGQWYLRAPDAVVRSSVNAQAAWDIVTGKDSVVVAVLDTGVIGDHLDLSGRVLGGYDMIEDVPIANDGNGRDSDSTDVGDWITSAENSRRGAPFEDCGISDSSWHGTQVAGIIGAAANNGLGMAGVAHGVRILPVRVLGKCGGYDSDIVAGIRWAAGLEVPGVPTNPTPARVLNLSLGGSGACTFPYQEAIAEAGAAPRHAVVVAAAGNSAGQAVSSPANCPGVIGVTGLRHAGTKVGFSDLGPEITIAAPGGNCVNVEAAAACLYPILTSSNNGTQRPNAGGSIWTDSYDYSVGTSFATPIVAGTVALMVSARPDLTPAQVIAAIRGSARPFPTSGADNGTDPTPVAMCRAPDSSEQLQCYCTVGLCGAGMLDARAAVAAVVPQVAPAEAARQLLEFGEQYHSHAFPPSQPTQVSGPFHYRYYPSTGYYLGVVVNAEPGYVLDGVYIVGPGYGDSPVYVGKVTDFITPRTF